MKNKKVLLGGREYASQYQKVDDTGRIVKTCPIKKYKGFLVDDDSCTVISEETEDKLVVVYNRDHVAAVMRQVAVGDEITFKPFDGTVCIVLLEGTKAKKGKIHFLWANMKAENFQYLELCSMGIECLAVMNLCQLLFSKLAVLMPRKCQETVELIDIVEVEDESGTEEEKNGISE